MTYANRGKEAEKLVKARLVELAKQADTVWYRPPDLRGGFKQEALTDFLLLKRGHLTLVEVKQTEHTYRLAHGNFGIPQVSRMRAWKWAGASALVLIYHSEIQKWRCLDIDYFVDRVGGSWDLREVPFTTLEETLK